MYLLPLIYNLKPKGSNSQKLQDSVKPINIGIVLNFKMTRDPRFDELSGTFNQEKFDKAYSFLDDIKRNERKVFLMFDIWEESKSPNQTFTWYLIKEENELVLNSSPYLHHWFGCRRKCWIWAIMLRFGWKIPMPLKFCFNFDMLTRPCVHNCLEILFFMSH